MGFYGRIYLSAEFSNPDLKEKFIEFMSDEISPEEWDTDGNTLIFDCENVFSYSTPDRIRDACEVFKQENKDLWNDTTDKIYIGIWDLEEPNEEYII